MAQRSKLLIAASGTGGHLFPALALAHCLADYDIKWLGVPDRLETRLVPSCYPLHTIAVSGFQQGLSLNSLKVAASLVTSVFQVRRLLAQQQIEAVFSTGGYIAAPAIAAARTLGIPAIIHESNSIPGKVTRWLSGWCEAVAIGFETTADYLPKVKTTYVGTPVRDEFLQSQTLDLDVPTDATLIVVTGGSQGAVAINQLVRQAAPQWLETGAWIVHLTGDRDPEWDSFTHPHYLAMPFYEDMAALLQRADLAVSRAGAGTLTELAVTATPSVLIPFPYAAEDHQTYNARVFADAGAAIVYNQSDLTAQTLQNQVLDLLASSQKLQQMKNRTKAIAVPDSAEQLAALVEQIIGNG